MKRTLEDWKPKHTNEEYEMRKNPYQFDNAAVVVLDKKVLNEEE